jgi:outer membrane protein assembly factor BamB
VKRFTALFLAVLALAGCSGGSKLVAEKPAALTEYTSGIEVTPVWAARIGKGVDAHYLKLPPLVDGQRVYSASRKGKLAAYAIDNGERVWKADLKAIVNAGPGEAGDLLLFGGNAQVIAVAKSDGAVRWQAPVSSEVLAPPVRAGDRIIVRTVDGAVVALSADDGSRLWQYRQEEPLLTLRGNSAPVVVGDIVMVGFDNGQLVALNGRNGRQIWDTTITVPRGRTDLERMVDIDARLAVGGRVVFADSYQGKIAAVAADTGRMLWSRDISSYSGLALADGNLYTIDDNGDVWALSAQSGGTLWKQTALHRRELSAPTVQGKYLVVGDLAGYLHWISREDGHLVARTRVHQPDYYFPVPPPEPDLNPYHEDRAVLAQPIVRGERVYAMDKRGAMNVFRIAPLKH